MRKFICAVFVLPIFLIAASSAQAGWLNRKSKPKQEKKSEESKPAPKRAEPDKKVAPQEKKKAEESFAAPRDSASKPESAKPSTGKRKAPGTFLDSTANGNVLTNSESAASKALSGPVAEPLGEKETEEIKERMRQLKQDMSGVESAKLAASTPSASTIEKPGEVPAKVPAGVSNIPRASSWKTR